MTKEEIENKIFQSKKNSFDKEAYDLLWKLYCVLMKNGLLGYSSVQGIKIGENMDISLEVGVVFYSDNCDKSEQLKLRENSDDNSWWDYWNNEIIKHTPEEIQLGKNIYKLVK